MIEFTCEEWLAVWREHLAINRDMNELGTGIPEADLIGLLGNDMPMPMRLFFEDDRSACRICGQVLNLDEQSMDCGGDCVRCMAEAGDPECVETMKDHD